MIATREPRCALTELLETQCAHCLGHGDVPADTQLTEDEIGPRFAARFSSRCAVCDGSIRVDEVIAALVDLSGYACGGCLP